MPRLLRTLLLALIALAVVGVIVGLAAGTGWAEKAGLIALLVLLLWAAFRLRRQAV